jgi:hypothetical protein
MLKNRGSDLVIVGLAICQVKEQRTPLLSVASQT